MVVVRGEDDMVAGHGCSARVQIPYSATTL